MKLDDKRAIFGWCMYDWANSAFATTVMAGFFPIFFKQFWSVGADATVSTARLGLANSLAGIIVAVTAPLLGAIADRGTFKKRFLLCFAFTGSAFTGCLYLVSQGNWPLAVLCYAIGVIGFSGGNIFYDAMITTVASERKMDFVSALGFSLGYLGGGILFAVNVWMTLSPETFGFENAAQAVQFSFLSVAVWWAIFSIPLIFFVQEPQAKTTGPGLGSMREGLIQLRDTFYQIRHLKHIFLFLIAYWFYIDGVDTIIRMAVDYGISIGFKPKDLIVSLLIVQIVGFPSSIAFGYLGGVLGTRRAIFVAISMYLVATLWGVFMQTKMEFYALAVAVGLVQGGIQALSRAYYAKIIPIDKAAEFFGFYNMIGKFGVVFGPVFMGMAGLIVRSMGYSSDIASRVSIGSIAIFFITGGILLFFVDEKKGREGARHSGGW
ncbi:MFS transporter [Thermodesulfobacteriota bacterium]